MAFWVNTFLQTILFKDYSTELQLT